MGNAAAMPASATIKLLIAKDTQVVLYAEAGKDVIDFLLSLLAMPAAAMIKHTSKETNIPLGALAILYASVEQMGPKFMRSPVTREALLNPSPAHPAFVQPAPPPPPPAPAVKVYDCSRGGVNDCFECLAVVENTPCPNCRAPMNVPRELIGSSDPPSAKAVGQGQSLAAVPGVGFVQGVATYMVMDDLAVAPMSAICGVTALGGLGVTDLTSLEVRSVQVGYNEAVEILRASLQSKTVLTDVFLRKNMGKQDDVAPSSKKKRN
ncbi:hypothetical protein HU200_055545 [Digitaria exilis]|uniref:Uncharacterized protein n=1 Tax=Digitaria exilis TaxID=1010633 RepID=A0A835AF29_9POAL|nr:hypothetical protein HU200_055545 [Digitaria exilis]CAB3472146.1 unnamed protein product [Digitaria exilis]